MTASSSSETAALVNQRASRRLQTLGGDGMRVSVVRPGASVSNQTGSRHDPEAARQHATAAVSRPDASVTKHGASVSKLDSSIPSPDVSVSRLRFDFSS
jgi:hypothetical protein